jgi:NitT/TauT family transport system ATP-binding protein
LIDGASLALSNLVVLSGVGFRHKGTHRDDVVRDFNLTIRRGEFLCILGPSGCGKTTVLNLLAGFERPTAGLITLSGAPLQGPGAERGVVFQGDASLYHWLTARQNVELGLRIAGESKETRRKIADEYLQLVGLEGQEDKYPSELSGGMKQRVNLARVLAGRAQILLMDEPFGQLDAQTRVLLQDELTQIWIKTKRTVFFVIHDIAEAVCLADRIVVMRRGPISNVKQIIDCDLPRPRDRGDPAFGRLYSLVNQSIATEVVGSRSGP